MNVSAPPDEPRPRVAFRRVQSEQIGNRRALVVFCPRRMKVAAVEWCKECDYGKGLCVSEDDRDAFMRCSWPEGEVASAARESPPPPSPAPLAQRTALAEVMTSDVKCVTADVSLDAVAERLLRDHVSAIPVVDAQGRAVGIVTKTDLLRYFHEQGEDTAAALFAAERQSLDGVSGFHLDAGAAATVADVMTHYVFSLPAEASITRAAALMAYEGVHRIVVTSESGGIVGLVSSVDVLRWLARADGYVIPRATRQQSP